MIRSAFAGLVDALASGQSMTSRRIGVQNTAGPQLWARQISTKGNSRVSAPWHHRLREQLARQNIPSQARRYTKFNSPLRFKVPPKRPFHSSRTRKAQQASKDPLDKIPEGSLTLSQRLKKLSREYGWSAVGVYLALTVIDFPFCFLLVRSLGTDRIAAAEHYVVSRVQSVIPAGVKQWWDDYRHAAKEAGREKMGEEVSKDVEMVGWGVKEADERNKEEASLATQLALAYAIHKSFIFVRVPLTAALTPKVVKVLRSWGWQIGKKVAKR